MNILILTSVFFLLFTILGYIIPQKRPMVIGDKYYSSALKGFSIITVLWSHIGAYSGVNGLQFIAGTGVSIFLILSGYGLELSFCQNSLTRFWTKRIVRIIIPYWIILTLYLIINQTDNIKENLLKYILINSTWFLSYIAICYILFYFSKLLFLKKRNFLVEIIVLFAFFTIFLIYECFFPNSEEIPFLRARQMFSFPFGVLLAHYLNPIKNQIQNLTKVRKTLLFLSPVIVATFCMLITQSSSIKRNIFLLNLLSLPTVLFFAISIFILTILFPNIVKNYFLYKLGIVSFEIFIIQDFSLSCLNYNYSGLAKFFFIVILGSVLLHIISIVLVKICHKVKIL